MTFKERMARIEWAVNDYVQQREPEEFDREEVAAAVARELNCDLSAVRIVMGCMERKSLEASRF